MKICSICNVAKEKSEFFYRDKMARRLHSQCKKCYASRRKKTWQDYYYRHGSDYRTRAVERNKRTKIHLRQAMLKYLEDKFCVRCGVNDIRVLEFDHINPETKSFTISRALTSGLGWNKILVEIAKCQILCANCHKIKTAQQGRWYRQ